MNSNKNFQIHRSTGLLQTECDTRWKHADHWQSVNVSHSIIFQRETNVNALRSCDNFNKSDLFVPEWCTHEKGYKKCWKGPNYL